MYSFNNYDPYQRLRQMEQGQQREIVRVNGRNGAEAFRMAPNSSCLLLDETAPLVWLCQSDGAGYHTVTPYKIEAYTPEPEPDFRSLDERMRRLEEMIYGQSDVNNAEQTATAE